jgi:hypothetical protein
LREDLGVRDASLLTLAIGELSASEARTLLARTDRPTSGRGVELRPRLREAVRSGDLAPEDVLRRLDEEALEALLSYAGQAGHASRKHADLLARIAALIREELRAPQARSRRSARAPRDGEPSTELERLREDLDRLLDERARLEAKNASLRHEVDRLREELHGPGASNAPEDLAELLRSIGIGDAPTFKKLYRSASKLLHPDKNAEGALAFRLLTKIRDLLEGKH